MSAYLVAGAALADKARTAITIHYFRDAARDAAVAAPPRAGEVPGVDSDVVERELHGMERGDRKVLADVVYGTERGASRAEVDEQLRWFCIAPTEEEEERIARGETVTFLVEP